MARFSEHKGNHPVRNAVFICYAHRDRKYLDELHEHLAPSLRAGIIEVWDDTRLQGGEEWREEIKKALASAKVAICLVSRSFRASKFIAENELPPLLAAAKAAGVIILPVIIGTCDFQESELAGVQAVNDPRKPLRSMRPNERDSVWVRVVSRVRELLTKATTTSGPAASAPSPSQGEAVKLLGESLSPAELVAYAAQLNREQQYDEAIRLLELLTRNEPDNQLAWFEYAYALAMSGRQVGGIDAFTRAHNLYQRHEHPDINEIKVPQNARHAIFAGVGSGTYNHGLLEKPDAIYMLGLGPHGRRQVVVDVMGSTTVHVTNTAAEPWVALAVKYKDINNNASVSRRFQMPALKTYNLFISHAWDYNEAYHRLVGMLNSAPYFEWANYSVPEHDPLGVDTDLALTRALYRQMRPTHAVLILAGMYVHHREWILKEIEIAQELGKPIIGLVPRGQERTAQAVQSAAKVMVNWNTASIVDAVRRYAL